MLWFICFFNYADRQAVFAIFPLLKAEFHFDKTQLGAIGAAFTLVYALSAPFAGQVGDGFPRKAVILGGLYVWSAVTGFTAICSKVWHFVLVRGAEGLGETFYFPASMSLISDYHSRATRSRAMSLHQTSVYAGTIGGSALAGWLGQTYGWRTPFLFLAVGGMALGVALAAFIREPRRNQAEREQGVACRVSGAAAEGRLEAEEGQHSAKNRAESDEPSRMPMSVFLYEWVRTPTAIALVIAFFGANFVALVFLTWMPTFLNEKFGLNVAKAGLGATFFIQMASLVGAAAGGMLADKWRMRHEGGRIFVQGFGALLGAPFIFACGYTREIWTLIGAMTAFGFCKGLYDANIWASLYDVVPAARRATAVGMMNMVGWSGGGLGSILIGVAVDRGMTMSAAISSTAIIYIIVACLLFTSAVRFAPRDIARQA